MINQLTNSIKLFQMDEQQKAIEYVIEILEREPENIDALIQFCLLAYDNPNFNKYVIDISLKALELRFSDIEILALYWYMEHRCGSLKSNNVISVIDRFQPTSIYEQAMVLFMKSECVFGKEEKEYLVRAVRLYNIPEAYHRLAYYYFYDEENKIKFKYYMEKSIHSIQKIIDEYDLAIHPNERTDLTEFVNFNVTGIHTYKDRIEYKKIDIIEHVENTGQYKKRSEKMATLMKEIDKKNYIETNEV